MIYYKRKKGNNLYKNKYVGVGSYNKKKKSGFKKFLRILLWFILIIVIVGIFVFGFWFKKNVLNGLPDVDNVKDIIFDEVTLIQDRNGKTLYKLFNENREYVSYGDISINTINAIVAIEDQRFWEHGGLDAIGIIRAAIHNVINPGTIQGASTISQQLLKNILLNKNLQRETFKEKIVRKLREFVLASKLQNGLKKEIINEYGDISKKDLHLLMKKNILELYLNYISFGNNAFGIEAASKTYFGISADKLDILQSSILASLPKGQSYYNPYKHKNRLMGELEIVGSNGESVGGGSGNQVKISIIEKFTKYLMKSDLSNKKEDGDFIKFVKGLGSFDHFYGGINYKVNYIPGRKDYILSRMYVDGYITENELKNSFVQGLDFEFRKHAFEILAPHFVQWVIEELEQRYDKETLLGGGLIIKTTLDYDIQKIAEEAIKDNQEAIDYYGANNEAMIYVDSKNGDVLAYVGSIDYFNEEIEGQNDMIRRPRQVGSSMKPFVYSYGFETIPLTLDTPMFDIPFKVGPDEPNNADGKFYGLLPLRKALAYSRNIPAIKMFLGAGGEEKVKPFLQKMGFEDVKSNHEYGYPLVLGAAEIPIMQLANGYMHLSARGKPAKINPILEIRSKNGALMYQKEIEYQEEVVKPGIAYLLWNILSDKSNMPPGWVAKYSVKGLILAIKSGTSNMKNDDNKNRARDGVLVGYTPDKVSVFWGGNTDGTPMYKNAYGGFLNADALTKFWSELKKNNYVSNKNMESVETTSVVISKISGKLANNKNPNEYNVKTTTYVYNQPESVDPLMESIEYDSLCNGLVSDYTPVDDIKKGYVIEPTSFMPNNMDLKDIKEYWQNSVEFTGNMSDMSAEEKKKYRVWYTYNNIFPKYPTEKCESRIPVIKEDIKIKFLKPKENSLISYNFNLWFNINSPRHITKVFVWLDDDKIADYTYEDKKLIVDTKSLNISKDLPKGDYKLAIEVLDKYGYSNKVGIDVELVSKESDDTNPILLEDKVKVNRVDGGYEVVLIFEDDLSGVLGGVIKLSGEKILEFENNLALFNLEELADVEYAVTDFNNNILIENIDLKKYY